jgi:hypothetical protein
MFGIKKPKKKTIITVYHRVYESDGGNFGVQSFQVPFIQHTVDWTVNDEIYNFLCKWKKNGVHLHQNKPILFSNVFKVTTENTFSNPGDADYKPVFGADEE